MWHSAEDACLEPGRLWPAVSPSESQPCPGRMGDSAELGEGAVGGPEVGQAHARGLDDAQRGPQWCPSHLS